MTDKQNDTNSETTKPEDVDLENGTDSEGKPVENPTG